MKSTEIDYTKWATQQQLATELNTSVQRIHNWVQRKKIETKNIPELNITLVNRFSINVKTINK